VAELGEAIDVVKKKGPEKITSDKESRAEFVKEVVDCYMYLSDVLNCYDVSAKEVTTAYNEKLQFNLKKPREYWKKGRGSERGMAKK